MKLIYLFICIAIMLCLTFLLTACTSGNANSIGNNLQANNNYRGMGRGMNLTDAQRQQMMQQQRQLAISACDGKQENDSCIMESQRGNMTGTCAFMNSTISCRVSFNRGTRGQPNIPQQN